MSRQTVAVGRIAQGETRLAIKCAWCDSWRSVEDEIAHQNGALVSHGQCPSCHAKSMAEIDAMPVLSW